MQYLIKITLRQAPLWRLVAVDGSADVAHVAELMAAAFDYAPAVRSFTINGQTHSAGRAGQPQCHEDLVSFDSLGLKLDDEFIFMPDNDKQDLVHQALIMRFEPKLYCFMPSCIVGSGVLPPEGAKNLTQVQQFLEEHDPADGKGLDLRVVTSRMRQLGVSRHNVSEALVQAGAAPLKFHLQ